MDTKNFTLNENWKFHLGECENAWYKGFDDSAWQTIRLPHDWSVTLPFDRSNSSGTGYVSGGIGWYRGRFSLPVEWKGKSVRLVFDGIYKNSQVWCNSYYLGKWPYGYSTFSYEITPFVCFDGQENEISVKVTHTDLADSRWFTGSGITRAVHLIVQEPVHTAQNGVFFRTGTVAFTDDAGEKVDMADTTRETGDRMAAGQEDGAICAGQTAGDTADVARKAEAAGNTVRDSHNHALSAQLEVSLELVNDTAVSRKTEAEVRLLDANGHIVLKMTGQTEVLPAAEAEIRQAVRGTGQTEFPGAVLAMEGMLEEPHLWSTEDPYLYRLQVLLHPEGQEAYLACEEKVGVRSIRFDADHGFFLNEMPMKLKGVCVHHDGGVLGAAMKAEVWERRLTELKECGCNAIRCSHNPHMPELYDLCDRMGFLMMDEAFDEWENAKNKWSTGHNVYPPRHQGYFEDFPQWHEADLRAMVRRDRNHPSVILWSIGNEIDYPNDPYCHPSFSAMTGNNDANKPAAEREYNPDKPNAERLPVLAARLARIVRQEDPGRPVTLAAAFPELSADLGFLDSLDVAGYNYKEHLYEKDHRRFPSLPFLGSENGHDYAAWKAVRDKEYISGQFLWTGIDYLGEAHGWPVRGSQAGLLTTAGDRKPEFYQTASFWKTEPVLHISTKPREETAEGRPPVWTPMQDFWNYGEGHPVTVICMSNAPEAALSLNGREIGRQKRNEEDGMFSFALAYEPGELKADAFDETGALVQTAFLRTSGPAVALRASLWQPSDAGADAEAEGALKSSAADAEMGCALKNAAPPVNTCTERGYLYQIKVELLDAQGHRSTADDRRITARVEGAGELAGLENGDLSDVSSYANSFRSTWLGRLTVYVRRTGSGSIQVHLAAEGIGEPSGILITE